jgi:hypothetical protein
MVKSLLVVAALFAMVGLVGCTFPTGAVVAPIMMTKSPVAVGDPLVGHDKTGTAEVEGIILLAKGDGSIKAAMQQGNIKRISWVDSEEFNVLGIYSKRTITVYGE